MPTTIERISEGCFLAEGPHWDVASQTLFFVDIYGKAIISYNPSTKKTFRVSTAPKNTSFIIPVEGKKDEFIISADNELLLISWDGSSDKYSVVEKLATVEKTKSAPNLSFNDAKCDSCGRLWVGTYSAAEDFEKTEPLGALYTLDGKTKLKSQLGNIKVSNGIAFNYKTKKNFFIDSLTNGVDRYDFDINTGTISNKITWFTLNKHNLFGGPDGMTIDTDGNLWVASFGGKRVLKIDGNKKETLLDTIEIPAAQVTSVAFGGPNLEDLYITTAAIPYGAYKVDGPENGATYRITGTGARGLPASNFRL